MNFDIYELLEKIKQRPAMYLGNTNHNSFQCLQSFLHGLMLSDSLKINPAFLEFGRWVSGRLENGSASMPFYQLEEEMGNDAAFDKYFELLDEYKNCEPICLERAVIRKTHKPNFYRIPKEDIYGREEPEKPLEICVGQFSPSKVFYLFELYINHFEKYFPFQNSIEEVKDLAKKRWDISYDEWFEV